MFLYVHVHIGTGLLGRVKSIGATPVITEFVTCSGLPVYPLRSFYHSGTGPTGDFFHLPFVKYPEPTVVWVPLAFIDKMSALVAYIRAISFLLVFFSVSLIGMGIAMRNRNQNRAEEFLMATLWVFVPMLVVGMVCGLLTYALPLAPRREYDIRRYCAQLLYLAVDPARVLPEKSANLAELADNRQLARETTSVRLIRQLVAARIKIAQAIDVERMETETDELLEKLNVAEVAGAADSSDEPAV